MNEQINEKISNCIEDCRFFSLTADESTDMGTNKDLIVYIKSKFNYQDP